MQYLYRVLSKLCLASVVVSFFLYIFFRGRAMEDDEDYGDVDIGCSSISIPRQKEDIPCEDTSTKKQEKLASTSDQKNSD